MNERLPDFGDLIRALARLQPKDEQSKREIANLLGFEFARPLPVLPPTPPPPPKKPDDLPVPIDEMQTSASSAGSMAAPSSVAFNTDVLPSVLRPLPSNTAPPNWGMAAPLAPPAATRRERPPPEPLLVPRWTRGILSAALGGRGAGGEIDIEAVVRIISDARPFRSVPRRIAPRFGRGVQVLVDGAESMLPFIEDQAWLTERIRLVAGRDRTEVIGVDGGEDNTFIAGAGTRLAWTDYFPQFVPLPGVVAILLSDLGIGRMPLAPWTMPDQWLSFANGLRRRGVPLVAIVPYPRERWPAALKGAIPIVHWDTRTTARSARRAVETRLRQTERSTA